MAVPKKTKKKIEETVGEYKYGFKTGGKSVYKTPKGLNRSIVEEISKRKNEPKWMLDFRLKAYEVFLEKEMPEWGGDLSEIDFSNIHYYLQPQDKPKTDWEDVPEEIKDTFEKLGIPQAEREFLAGTGAQFESEVVYHSLKKELKNKGVIFESTEVGLQKYPEIFKEHFGKIIPSNDNKFAALNSAVWSGGSFIYIPKGVHVGLPLQAYFRINAENMGQFERTLIIADEGSSVHYIEGCTAPTYSTDSLHAAVVEVVVKKNARVQYTTLQNWSQNIYNLVTKRAHAHENAEMFWLDCNIGSGLTMKYPAIHLMGKGARGEVQSLAFSGKNQHQDAGAKIIHAAPNTSSTIVSKSISKDGGRGTYRGLLKVNKGASNVKSHIACDALLLDDESRSDTYPVMKIDQDDVAIAHEATVSKIGEEQLFYLMSRGMTEEEAASTIVNGFAKPIIKQLPMEYALELNRLLEIEMEGSVG
ncbi:Fe-S cluster assembly protein SufB [Candidatus Peregrinibacteria bacterium]|jgi:Fe-S cluster assembly protein SufB|nr:Fe-S cluster assembly protein SufB [Candidatus Peregrinibacteria bacterium]MBT7736623.1 Fe-S cluster assembly protein SufB [Candidatus Peregrinibacteria bacterium]